jgi:hypothetical protein
MPKHRVYRIPRTDLSREDMPDHHPMLVYNLVAGWPQLAWLAVCDSRTPIVTIYHVPRIETGEKWFCEAAWAGEFDEGGLDLVETVVGSGGRLRGDRLPSSPRPQPLAACRRWEVRPSRLKKHAREPLHDKLIPERS